MPQYQFKDCDGRIVELPFGMNDVPAIGTAIEHAGRRLIRVVSTFQIHADVHNVVHKYPYESFALEPGWPGTRPGPRGGTIVPNRKTEREIRAMSRDSGAELVRV